MDNLPVKKESGLATSGGFWGEMDHSDFAIPHVNIGQGTSRKGQPGQFNYNNGTSVPRLTGCKLIVPKKGRVLFGKTFDSPSRCKSDNFYNPSDLVKNPISNNCLTCFASQWGEDNEQKKALFNELNPRQSINKPLCAETYNLLMVDGQWRPFFIKFFKVQLKVVSEKLFSKLRYEFANYPPYGVSFDMSTDRIVKGENIYYSVKFENFQGLGSEDLLKAENYYNQIQGKVERILSQQHEAMDKEHREREATPVMDGAPMPDADEEIPF